MPDPLVVLVMRGFKADLLAHERGQVSEMTRRWFQMEKDLQASFDALANEAAAMQANGQTVTAWQLYRMQRYQSLLKQIETQLAEYNAFASRTITAGQQELMRMAREHSAEAIQATYANFGQVAGAFDRLPVSALEFMTGLAGDGSPLTALLKADYADSVDGITRELLKALVMGQNPTRTAAAIARGFGMGLDRALLIARTEQLRVYRESSRLGYQNSGVVRGYQRISARDDRVCPACLFADNGQVYPVGTPFEEHPQGRCTAAPVLIGLPATEWQSGIDWFKDQTAESQKSILGAAKWSAWQSGAFKLEDVVQRKPNETWGASLIPASLKALVGAA